MSALVGAPSTHALDVHYDSDVTDKALERIEGWAHRAHALPPVTSERLSYLRIETAITRFQYYLRDNQGLPYLSVPATATRSQLWNAMSFINLQHSVRERFGFTTVECMDYDLPEGSEAFSECNLVLTKLMEMDPSTLSEEARTSGDTALTIGIPGASWFTAEEHRYTITIERGASRDLIWNLLRSISLVREAQKSTGENSIACDPEIAAADNHFSCMQGLGKLADATDIPRIPRLRSITIGDRNSDDRRANGSVTLDYRSSAVGMTDFLKEVAGGASD